MTLLDERGRLFGVVNVVDALVVLAVAVLVAGGIFLVVAPDQTAAREESRYGTISYSVPLQSEAAPLAVGDTLSSVRGGDPLEVLDVYRSFGPNATVHVVSRVEYAGELTAGGSRLYGGDTGEYLLDGYRVSASILGVDQDDPALPVRNASVVLSSTDDPAVARALDAGDRASIGGDVVATVEAVGPREDGRFHVGTTLKVWDTEPVPVYDGESLRVGNRVTIATNEAVLRGRVAALGTTDPAVVRE